MRTMLQLFRSATHGTLFTTHALLKTATPFLRHWGMPPKGRTVFRREARYSCYKVFSSQNPSANFRWKLKLVIRRRRRGNPFGWSAAKFVHHVPWPALLDGVIRRHGE